MFFRAFTGEWGKKDGVCCDGTFLLASRGTMLPAMRVHRQLRFFFVHRYFDILASTSKQGILQNWISLTYADQTFRFGS